MIAVSKFTGQVFSGGIAPAPDADTASRIEKLWSAARKRHPALFDGTLAGVTRASDNRVDVTWWRYSAFVAQQMDPTLFATLGLRPLGVSGRLLCADGLVLGQRQATASQDAGLWEFAPAGSVDDGALADDGTVDLAKALLDELGQELGLTADDVTPPEACLWTDNPATHVCDVFLTCETALSGPAVQDRWAAKGDGEYAQVAVIPVDEMAAFAAANSLSPVTLAVLATEGLGG